MEEHNSSKNKSAKYTKGRRPVKLEYLERCKSLSHALKREYEIKQFTKKQKENMIAISRGSSIIS